MTPTLRPCRIRSLGPFCAALWLFSAGLGGCSSVGSGPPCAPGVEYPLCLADNNELLRCVDGEELSEVCATGSYCLDLVDGGDRFSACVPGGSLACDAGTYVAFCASETSRVVCAAPDGHPAAGHTLAEACPDGHLCLDDPAGALCYDPNAPPPQDCDPADYPGECRENSPVRCDANGAFVESAPCPTPLVCRVGTKGAVCVDDQAAPCDPNTFVPHCAPGGVIACDPARGFTAFSPCPAETPCVVGPAGAVCGPPPAPDCDVDTFVPHCEDNMRVLCSAVGETLRQPCGAALVCRESAAGAFCLEPWAVLCDPAAFTPRCVDPQVREVCSPVMLYTRRDPCPFGRPCTPTPNGAICALQGRNPQPPR